MTHYSLFIDDERYPPDGCTRNWMIARNIEEVIQCITAHGMPSYVSFDHDLGDATTASGYDIAKLLVEYDMDNDPLFCWPDDFSFTVHSQNPPGAVNISSYINNYLTHCKKRTD